MDIKQSASLALEKWFSGFLEDVDPDNDSDGLTEQRLEQWRPLWQNPFADPDIGLSSGNDHSQAFVANIDADDEKALEHTRVTPQKTGPSQESLVPKPIQGLVTLTHAGPAWVNLFYDLAWTATFSTLTQNGNFADAWVRFSRRSGDAVLKEVYVLRILYLISLSSSWSGGYGRPRPCIAFISTPTTGSTYFLSSYNWLYLASWLRPPAVCYDVTACILNSPGAEGLDPQTMDSMIDPDRYQKDRIASYSMRVIAFSLAASRAVHWFQHLFVWSYARRTAEELKISAPLKLRVLPVGLAISNGFFWAAALVTFLDEGKTISGAKLKFVFWGAGLISEVLLHALMEHLKWEDTSFGPFKGSTSSKETLQEDVPPQPEPHKTSSQSLQSTAAAQQKQTWPIPRSNVDLRERLEGITTVILGEVGYLLPIVELKLNNVHVWERSLTNDVVAVAPSLYVIYHVAPAWGEEPILANKQSVYENFLLKHGLKWADEFKELHARVTRNETILLEDVPDEDFSVAINLWYFQIYLKIVVKLYEVFMGGSKAIDSETEAMIQQYYQDNSILALEIITKLLESNLLGARYITGLAAIILISLGIMNRLHSKPQDRFQWGIILTRISMGISLLFLLLLGVGHYQTLWVLEEDKNMQAGVFRWIWAQVIP
ncbi:unnamed protein product [Rhizoctonia solani]|uniref:Uncharacterized protein n=1 Tax=Rhizoctonia solani TaxID=456999 RepID=A0A8H2WBF5_9AGAM|nr:unnamed protein product [Rhizoctonia solani]